MLFRRRKPQSRTQQIRTAMWPRGSWARSLKYFGKRVLRLSASPHAIALGFAAGVLVSWTPLFGLHFIMAIVIAFLMGGNAIAAFFGTAVGNPITFPFMWWLSYTVGSHILALGPGAPKLPLGNLAEASWSEILAVLPPMLLGAVPLGLVSGTLAYFIVRGAVRAYQAARRERLASRKTARDSAAPES
ncbi:DUF2062 domain-containing protein [Bauldia sp.]|uniref:DUF2062 domain-containing protein n=1 Tax=Bauldia sp. TaxID=2575872 RepID=UPI003BABC09F